MGAVPQRTLIFHDRDDRVVPVDAGRQLAEAWARPINVTFGFGHNRILAAPEVLDTIAQGSWQSPETARSIDNR